MFNKATNKRAVKMFAIVTLATICQCNWNGEENRTDSSHQASISPTGKAVESSANKKEMSLAEKTTSILRNKNEPALQDKNKIIKSDTTTPSSTDDVDAGVYEDCATPYPCIFPVGGWLSPTIDKDVLLEKLGKPDKEDIKKSVYDGEEIFIQFWTYNKHGIIVKFTTFDRKTPFKLSLIIIRPPCKLTTEKGIGIGSSYDEVEKAHAGGDLKTVRGDTILTYGTCYWGTTFKFENNKVVEIRIGERC